MNKELENNAKRGRPAGSPNKRNLEVFELAEEFKITPMRVKFMLMCLKLKELGYSEESIKELSTKELIEIQDRNAADIAPYMYGKRKPIDSNGDDSSSLISEVMDFIDASKR